MRTHAWRPRIGRIALSCAGLALLAAAPTASAATNEIYDFNVYEWTTTYGSYTSTTNSGVSYRWVDSPWKPTYIASANCANNSPYGETYFPSGYTGYQWIGTVPAGWCFNLRGRTAPGWGSMFYYDGRLAR